MLADNTLIPFNREIESNPVKGIFKHMVIYTKDNTVRAWDTWEEASKYLTEEQMKEVSDDGKPPREKMNLDDYDVVILTDKLWTLVRKEK